MEILAPVGDKKSLEAAVKCGADAVYFGASDFNARRNADNFNDREFCEALKYCRQNGVKSHIVLNTLLHDDEILRAVDLAVTAAQNGADAFIVQDTGLALLLRERLPDVSLHASTQMTVHSTDGLIYAKNLGFDRVVLSRELSFDEISILCKKANELNIEIEVFIHGALCMSMSGQCYLSAMIGGRSGNRGLCAQPCRLPFKTPEGYEYSLSLKDMSHLSYIQKLGELGVSSLKIEGRMKDAEYVAAAVTAAREARDTGNISDRMQKTLSSAFSRSGFCDGYITGKKNNMFGIRTDKDTLLSKEVQNSIHELYRREFQRIGITFEFVCKVGKPAVLRVTDSENSVEVFGDTVQPSIGRPLEYDFVLEKLSKLGGTPYLLKCLEFDTDENAYLPISEINDLKKRATELLTENRNEIKPIRLSEIVTKPVKREGVVSQTIRARFNKVLPQDLHGISRAYLTHDSDDELFIKLVGYGIETGVELPRVFFCSTEKFKDRLQHLKTLGVKFALCEGFAAFEIAKSIGLGCDMGMFSQITNSYSCISAKNQGAASVISSFECTVEQINEMASPLPKGYVGYGYLPLMMTRCCPLKNSRGCADCKGDFLTDRKNVQFFARCRDGVTELFNCVPLEMCNKAAQFKNADFVLLYFTNETATDIQSEINDWNNKRSTRTQFTHGLYYRGVQ